MAAYLFDSKTDHGIGHVTRVYPPFGGCSCLDAAGEGSSETRALATGLLADCSTRIVYRQETDQLGQTAALLGLTSTERAILTDLGVGEGLWRIGNRAFRTQHQMTSAEHDTFDTTGRMIDLGGSGSAAHSVSAPLIAHR
jgi:hypothetical protein